MEKKEIVIVLTNKGYVAIAENQIFDLWKTKPLNLIYEELSQRYLSYDIHLGSLNRVDFKQAVEVSNQYLKELKKLKFIKAQNMNLKNHHKMKQLTFNKETATAIAKVAAGFSTQKLLGTIHFTVQTSADILQYGADTVAKGEATILSKLNIYNESKEELIKIRKDRSIGYQELIKQAPSKLLIISKLAKDKVEALIENRKTTPINQ